MNKFIQNNRVAVLTNPESGWYCVHGDLAKLFDPDLVQKVLNQDPTAPPGLIVEWLVLGDHFVVEWFQGLEVIRVFVPDIFLPFSRNDAWLVA